MSNTDTTQSPQPDHLDLEEQRNHLADITGNGTELITVTIPPDKSITSVQQRIADEHASAEHIKSDHTRDHVQQALDRIHRILKRYPETPDSGLAIYAGVTNTSLDAYVYDDLPTPVSNSRYQCSDHYDTTPLDNALTPTTSYGLIAIERGGAAIGTLANSHITTSHDITSTVMGKTRAGGQSAQRFKRERERQAHEFYQTVATLAEHEFLTTNTTPTVSGIIIGGTLTARNQFIDNNYLHHTLATNIIATHPIEYATEHGLRTLADKASDAITDSKHQSARDALDTFYNTLATEPNTVAYGHHPVNQALEYNAVDTLLAATTLPTDQQRDLDTRVSNQGGTLITIPDSINRGQQFITAFNGLAALLRYPIHTQHTETTHTTN